jgi:predicted small metal-binding protein
MIKEMRGICIECEFQIRGNTLEELDENFRSHFENTGHDTYFFREGEKSIERCIS